MSKLITVQDGNLVITATGSDVVGDNINIASFRDGYITTDNDNLTFADSGNGGFYDTITSDDTGVFFGTAGFRPGMHITITGSASNDGTYVIGEAGVTDTTITIIGGFTAEGPVLTVAGGGAVLLQGHDRSIDATHGTLIDLQSPDDSWNWTISANDYATLEVRDLNKNNVGAYFVGAGHVGIFDATEGVADITQQAVDATDTVYSTVGGWHDGQWSIWEIGSFDSGAMSLSLNNYVPGAALSGWVVDLADTVYRRTFDSDYATGMKLYWPTTNTIKMATAADGIRIVGDINTATPPTTEGITAHLNFVDLAQDDIIGQIGYDGENELVIDNLMRGGTFVIRNTGATAGNGGSLSLVTANTTTSGISGDISLSVGNSAGTDTGGAVNITAGGSGAGATGTGGALTITSGESLATNGAGGAINIVGGVGAGSGADGLISLTTEAASVTWDGTSLGITNLLDTGDAVRFDFASNSEAWISAAVDGAVSLYHNGTQKAFTDQAGLGTNDGLYFVGSSSHGFVPGAGSGALWLDSDDDTMYFRDDGGTDYAFAGGTVPAVLASGTPVDNQIAVWTAANTIEGDANLTWTGTVLATSGIVELTATGVRAAAALQLESANPSIYIQETGATANEGNWSLTADGDTLTLSTASDIDVAGQDIMSVTRTAAVINDITLGTASTTRVLLPNPTNGTQSSTSHAFQIGPTSGANLRMGSSEITAVNNAGAAPLYLQNSGNALSDVYVWNAHGAGTAGTFNLRNGGDLEIYDNADSNFIRINCNGSSDGRIYTDATELTFYANTNLTLALRDVRMLSEVPLLILEDSAAVADVANYGQIWVRDDAPNVLAYTDDTGQDIQISPYRATVTTPEAAVTEIISVPVASGSGFGFEVHVMGTQDATGDTVFERIFGAIRNQGGTTALVGSTITDRTDDAGATTWVISVEADDTGDALTVDVTGEASHTIDWKVSVVPLDV